jgi:hypothetical protein
VADAAALVSGDRIADGSTDCSTDGRTDGSAHSRAHQRTLWRAHGCTDGSAYRSSYCSADFEPNSTPLRSGHALLLAGAHRPSHCYTVECPHQGSNAIPGRNIDQFTQQRIN